MRPLTLSASLAILALALVGCSQPAEPDEAGFLAAMSEAGYEELGDEANLESGHNACERAEDGGETVADAADGVAQFIADSGAREWTLTSAAAASVYLCPHLAD